MFNKNIPTNPIKINFKLFDNVPRATKYAKNKKTKSKPLQASAMYTIGCSFKYK